MKTIKNTSKSLLLASSLFVLMSSSFNSLAQNGIIWTKTQNFNDLGIYEQNNKVFSSDEKIQTLIDTYSIDKIQRAVPASRKRALQNLVEITCNCDEIDLLIAISKLTETFNNPEIGPHYSTLELPNDYTVAFTEDYALDLINAKNAWDITHGDSSIIIAISDQNFQINHEELIGKIHHYDAANTLTNTHGTAVAITAAGNTNNSVGKSAIGYNSELALYQMSYNELIIATYAGYKVINASWASGCIQSDYIQDVIDEIYENGSIIVAAAGNGTTCGGPLNLVYPASCEHVISVTSIGRNNNHESVLGDSLTTHQHNEYVDIAAPGISVPLSGVPGSYVTSSGTSFAAPLVSGTIALMLSVDSCLTFEDIETILHATAVNIDDLNPNYAGLLGAGKLDAGAAVQMASTYMSCTGGNEPNPSPDENPIKSPNLLNSQVESTAGLNEEEAVDFNVFPNPSTNGSVINIVSSDGIETCDITTINGEIIQHITPNSNQLKLDNLAQGTYFVSIQFNSGVTKIKRLIVF